jgi:NADPH:quinone reductase-like Zn-dependent oxidoreductase
VRLRTARGYRLNDRIKEQGSSGTCCRRRYAAILGTRPIPSSRATFVRIHRRDLFRARARSAWIMCIRPRRSSPRSRRDRPGSPVKAIVQIAYGLPRALELRDVERPRIGDGQILVKVHAASVNALDFHIARGMPYLTRSGGLRAPRDNIRGVDLSGRIEAVGKDVAGFNVGDEVFGGGNGSFAEYTATTPERLALKSGRLTHEQAASFFIAGLTALQGLRDKARLQAGHSALIIGAGGGVGTFAVQFAKWLGADVTAVTRTENIDLVRSIGADDVIDYHAEDFASRGKRYDVLFDISGNRPFADCRRVLAQRGTLIAVGAPAGRWLAPATRLLGAAALSPFVSQTLTPLVAKPSAADLALMNDLAEAGKIRPVIDREYALSETVEALTYLGTGRARGKVIIKIL